MVKVKDTLKRNIKFTNVRFRGEDLVDELGDVLAQLKEELPEGVEDFELQVNVAIPQVSVNEDGEVLSDE